MAFVRIRQDGTLTIPAHIRHQGEFVPGAWVSLQTTAGGGLSLVPQVLNCSLCGHRVPTLDRDTNICPTCVSKITKSVRAGATWVDAIKIAKEGNKYVNAKKSRHPRTVV